MKAFQFSVSTIAEPLVEAKDAQGNLILTPIVEASSITQAMGSDDVRTFCGEQYRIFRAVRK